MFFLLPLILEVLVKVEKARIKETSILTIPWQTVFGNLGLWHFYSGNVQSWSAHWSSDDVVSVIRRSCQITEDPVNTKVADNPLCAFVGLPWHHRWGNLAKRCISPDWRPEIWGQGAGQVVSSETSLSGLWTAIFWAGNGLPSVCAWGCSALLRRHQSYWTRPTLVTSF